MIIDNKNWEFTDTDKLRILNVNRNILENIKNAK